jgi:DNA polymerase-3 subunit epsilon
LLDARILADVYLAMTGGQGALQLSESGAASELNRANVVRAMVRPSIPLRVVSASAEELAAHAAMLEIITKASGGRCVWSDLATSHIEPEKNLSSA